MNESSICMSVHLFCLFGFIRTYVMLALVLRVVLVLVLVAVPLFILEDKLLYTYILRTASSLLLALEFKAAYLQ